MFNPSFYKKMATVNLKPNMTTKFFETFLEVGIGLLATFSIHFLQVQTTGFVNFSPQSIANSIACLAGSFAYTSLFMKDEKMSYSQAFFSAVVGYTFGIYAAGFYCEYRAVDFGSYHAKFAYLMIGFCSMLVMVWIYDFGKGFRKNAKSTGEKAGDILKSKLPKK
jgi:hypothetical protein